MSHRFVCRFIPALLVLVALVTPVRAEVKLPAVFADHMVLQREMPIRIWGQAGAGEKVTVSLGDRTGSATAGADGLWKVTLEKLPAGGPFELTVSGANKLVLKDVLIGEVWLCSGQSNMNMPIDWGVFGAFGSPESNAALAEINDPQLRMFLVGTAASDKPASDVTGQWKIAKGNEVLKWSAAGYFFGAELRRELGVPVGIVKSSVGGTLIESWTRREALIELKPTYYKPIFDRLDRTLAAFNKTAFEKKVGEWQKEADKAKAEGKKAPPKPVAPAENIRSPAGLYNAMIAPLVPYTIRGIAWYQGESNAHNGYAYGKLFPAMIRDWRAQWGEGDIPFLFVQLANFGKVPEQPGDSQWAEVRESQVLALKEPNTAMIVTIDIGDPKDIHPKNKQDVGKRLGLAALKLSYGRNVVHSGPVYEKMAVQGKTIRVSFSHVGGGLVAKGEKLKGFAIAGADKKFVWAEARIDGDSVVVSSEAVGEPAAVRYGWADSPECNLSNKEGLPASPFRTDDWTVSTESKD